MGLAAYAYANRYGNTPTKGALGVKFTLALSEGAICKAPTTPPTPTPKGADPGLEATP